jgi:uncharacterized membrane protein
MTQIYRIIYQLSWLLGLLSIFAAVMIKLLHLEARLATTSHTAFVIASAFFLCSLATRERTQST